MNTTKSHTFSILLPLLGTLAGCTDMNPLFAPDAGEVGLMRTPEADGDGGDLAPVGSPDMETGAGSPDGSGQPDMVTAAAAADMTPTLDLVALPDLVTAADMAPDCSLARASCREHLKAGCNVDGSFTILVKGAEMKVWCEMQDDGGGWALAYSNANNWASEGASTIASMKVNGNDTGKWYDSRWALDEPADKNRLGRGWNGRDPLRPDQVGSNDLQAIYESGLTNVRFDFVQGSDGATSSGWCATEGTWDWSASSAKKFTCKRNDGNNGSNHMLCLGRYSTCDGHDWNTGWIGHITLGGDNLGDYAYQSAPNHLYLGFGCNGVGFPCTVAGFVVGWAQKMLNGNAAGKDYQVRIWLR